jgi:hypothetical protein
MKMTKKLFLVAIATAAFALTGCDMLMPSGAGKDTFKGKNENGTDNGSATQQGVKKNLTIKVEAKVDTDHGSKLYQRMFRQLGTSENVEALQTKIQIDTSKSDSFAALKEGSTDLYVTVDTEAAATKKLHAVAGLIFDMHKVTEKEVDDETGKKVKKSYYDFVLIGYRPYDDGFYIEKYKNIAEDLFAAATNDTGFGDGSEVYITQSQSGFVYAPAGTEWVTSFNGKLGKDDDGVEGKNDVPIKEYTVTITQPENGKFNINIAGQDFTYTADDDSADHPKWYNKAGKRIGGAGYYVNAPLGTAIYANFNSKNDITKGLEEEVEE